MATHAAAAGSISPMERLNRSDRTVIRTLAQMPFLEFRELAGVAHIQEPTTCYYSLKRLQKQGLVDAVHHLLSKRSRMSRWYLLPAGIGQLAQMEEEPIESIVRRLPLSLQWRRSLLRRLDAVATSYRIALDAAVTMDCTLRWRWERSGPVDAYITLQDGRTVGIARFGTALPPKGIRSRLGTLMNMRRQGQLTSVMLVVPDAVRRHTVLQWTHRSALNVDVAIERDVRDASVGDALWHNSSYRPDTGFGIDAIFNTSVPLPPPRAELPKRAFVANEPIDADDEDALACRLTRPASVILDALTHWPLMRPSDLQRVLGISPEYVRTGRAQLAKERLLLSIRVGKRGQDESKLMLSRNGLRYLSWRDRTRIADLDGMWGAYPIDRAPHDRGYDIQGLSLTGTRLRVLGREPAHTEGVHQVVGILTQECRASVLWHLDGAHPPHHCERWFRHNNKGRFIRPDAALQLSTHPSSGLMLLMEYEQRALWPSRMIPKIETYRRFHEALETVGDFSVPWVLAMIFADAAAASRFAQTASRIIAEHRTAAGAIPMVVSSIETMERKGALGSSWMLPAQLERGEIPLETLLKR